MNSGDAAWMLIATALVLLMTPAVAFFYGGMVRAKAVLNMLMLSVGAIVVASLVWVGWGWSIAYAGKSVGGIFGDPITGFFLRDVITVKDDVYTSASLGSTGTYPQTIDVAFQLTFAVISVALITGAIAERVKFSTWLVFVALWTTFVYAPMAHMVWNGGLLSSDGLISQLIGASAHDFAGGTVVHINAAVSALIVVLVIGNRRGFGSEPMKPHNVPFVVLGAFLLLFGWMGFNGGSAFAANGTAGYTLVTTIAAAAAATLGWVIMERIRTGKYTAVGAASGMVAGLVGITPAADVVSPFWAIVIGLAAGAICFFAVSVKYKLGFDDSLDVVGVHGVGGVIGTVLLGLFSVSGGVFTTGSARLVIVQILIALFTIVFSGALTWIIAFGLHKTMGWRVNPYEEMQGIDISHHGERGYELGTISRSNIRR